MCKPEAVITVCHINVPQTLSLTFDGTSTFLLLVSRNHWAVCKHNGKSDEEHRGSVKVKPNQVNPHLSRHPCGRGGWLRWSRMTASSSKTLGFLHTHPLLFSCPSNTLQKSSERWRETEPSHLHLVIARHTPAASFTCVLSSCSATRLSLFGSSFLTFVSCTHMCG